MWFIKKYKKIIIAVVTSVVLLTTAPISIPVVATSAITIVNAIDSTSN